MKWYLFNVFVIVFLSTLVKGYNIPLPLALLAPRTKYDYDLTRFFPTWSSEGVNFQDSTQVHHSPIQTTELPFHLDETCHKNHATHFGSPFNPFYHRTEDGTQGQAGFYKSYCVKFQHEPPKKPYRPTYDITNTQYEDKTSFASPFSFNQHQYFPPTTASPLTTVPPAPWLYQTTAPAQGNIFGSQTTKQTYNSAQPLPSVPRVPSAPWLHPAAAPAQAGVGTDTKTQAYNPIVHDRFGQNEQQHTAQGFGAPSSSQSFNQQSNYQTTTLPSPVNEYRTTTTTAKPKNNGVSNQLLTSLLGGDTEVKYKETETDYYDFDEADLKRPQYDISASRKLFAEFVQKYGKMYKDKQDEEVHYQHFVNSLQSVNRLNAEGGSASFDINIMSDEDPNVFG